MVYGYILVTLKSGAERDVCEKVANFEEVVQVDELYGEYDAIAKVRAKDLADLDKFLTENVDKFYEYYGVSDSYEDDAMGWLMEGLRYENTGIEKTIEDNEIIRIGTNYELKILWLLNNNRTCAWVDLRKSISQSTLAKNLFNLLSKIYIKKISNGDYEITWLGKLRLKDLQNQLFK